MNDYLNSKVEKQTQKVITNTKETQNDVPTTNDISNTKEP